MQDEGEEPQLNPMWLAGLVCFQDLIDLLDWVRSPKDFAGDLDRSGDLAKPFLNLLPVRVYRRPLVAFEVATTKRLTVLIDPVEVHIVHLFQPWREVELM